MFLGSCGSSVVCRGNLVPSLRIRVLAPSGAAECDADVLVRDGRFERRLASVAGSSGSCSYVGPTERRGSYTVTATAAGLEDKATVTVGYDRCHVETADLSLGLA